MERIDKAKSYAVQAVDAVKDIELINQYSIKELKSDEVFCFSTVLCDNEVDRDGEAFTDESLEKLAELMNGKTGIKDHVWKADNQIARIYRAEVETTKEKNSLGKTLKRLRGSAYMLRTDENDQIIKSIEGGILKEISIGFAIEKLSCSICGERMRRGWFEPTHCKNDHIVGQTYDEKTCIGMMENPTDAYEFSFVAVPAQRGAGAVKGFRDKKSVFNEFVELITVDDLRKEPEAITMLENLCATARKSAEEMTRRRKIAEQAKKFII